MRAMMRCTIAQIAPTGMIFVPCENGLSHNELEHAEAEDLIAGGNVTAASRLRAG